tara:strand:- start:1999 stop:2562 length:564 start_codon:yes stop_codon:yes gene_type:complete
MNKEQLKKLLKPIVAECIQEEVETIRTQIKDVLYEENGVLTRVVSEVAVGMSPLVHPGAKQIDRTPRVDLVRGMTGMQGPGTFYEGQQSDPEADARLLEEQKAKQAAAASKAAHRKMLDSIGKDAYNGVNIFEGTAPLSSGGAVDAAGNDAGSGGHGPLSGMDPNDAGIDISGLMGNTGIWKRMADG